jgi:putative acetyltransferase
MQILLEVAKQDAIDKLFADVSMAAKPFFASWGFDVEREQLVHIDKEVLKNYRMSKSLCASTKRTSAVTEIHI